MANFLLRRKLATPRPSGGVSDGPAGRAFGTDTLLIMARWKGRAGLSPCPAYIVSAIVEAAGCMVAKHWALPHHALTWGFPPYPMSAV